eukprot:m.141525 g.141525  ORF g.141525 m.141525 type:complete len:293 (+) comp16697_c0_seq1:78-956(+)
MEAAEAAAAADDEVEAAVESAPRDLSGGLEAVALPWTNDVDSAVPPPSVTYVRLPVLPVDGADVYPGCRCCDPNGTSATCDPLLCPCIHTGRDEPLTERPQPLVMECGPRCSCSVTSCPNRQVGRGSTLRLQVFRTSDRGWGLRTLDFIPRGQYVCCYAGEVVSRAEAALRAAASYDRADDNYLMQLREHVGATGRVLITHVDATRCGSAGRYVNHSCDPNLEVVPVRCGLLVPVPAMFARIDIPPLTELTFDYGEGAHPSSSKNSTNSTTSNKPCRCGARSCRGFMPHSAL